MAEPRSKIPPAQKRSAAVGLSRGGRSVEWSYRLDHRDRRRHSFRPVEPAWSRQADEGRDGWDPIRRCPGPASFASAASYRPTKPWPCEVASFASKRELE